MCSRSHILAKANGLVLQGEITDGMIFVPFVPQPDTLDLKNLTYGDCEGRRVCLKSTPHLTSLIWSFVYRRPRHGQSSNPSTSCADGTKIHILLRWKIERNRQLQYCQDKLIIHVLETQCPHQRYMAYLFRP